MDINVLCKDLLKELYKFSNDVITFGEPINDDRLENFEKSIGFSLPTDFKNILKKHNGISILGKEILGYDKQFQSSSLEQVYQFEHFEVANKMPPEYVPFSPDGRGNHYCLDLSRCDSDISPIVFWQWDFQYDNTNEIETCNYSFIEWVKEVMIEWTLEDYNYDGSEK